MAGPRSPQIITPFIQSHRVFCPTFRILVLCSGSSFFVPDPRSSLRILVPRSGSSFLVPDPRSSFRILVPRSGSSFLIPDPRSSSSSLFLVPDPRSGSSFRILVPEYRSGISFRNLVPDPRSSFRILVPRSGSSFLVSDPRSSFQILVPRSSFRILIPLSGSSFLVPDLTLDLSQYHSNLKSRFTKSLRVMLSRRRDPLSILKLLHVRVKSEKVYMNYHHVHHRKEDLHNCQIYISLKVRLRWFGGCFGKTVILLSFIKGFKRFSNERSIFSSFTQCKRICDHTYSPETIN